MREILFIIPILWVIVATACGLVLYKTSRAFFVQKNTGKDSVRELRLFGSIVIAGVIFFALKWATPESLLLGRDTDAIVLSKDKLTALFSEVDEAKNAAAKLEACTAIAPAQECKLELDTLRTRINGLGSGMPKP